MSAPDTRPVIRLGVFLPSGSQLLDMASVDIFGTMSYEYLAELGDELSPPPIVAIAPRIKILCTCETFSVGR